MSSSSSQTQASQPLKADATRKQRAGGRHRRLGLPLLIGGSVALAVAAGAVARGFVSPAQQAARASAPVPSLITAPVKYGVLPLQIVMRATVAHDDPSAVAPPSDVSGPEVVTSVNVASGQHIRAGQLIATVAEQPVFVMMGRVPAFREIAPGTSGIDVRELQAGLIAAGHRIGSDQAGTYGPGTAAAVGAMYRADHLQPDVAPDATRAVAQQTAALANAERAVSTTTARLGAFEQRGKHFAAEVGPARRALASADAAVVADRRRLQRAQVQAEPVVPLGAISFVARLPGTVLSVAALGSTVAAADSGSSAGGGSGSSARTGSSSALASIGSSRVVMTGSPGQGGGQLRRGMIGTASSEVSGQSVRVRVLSTEAGKVVFAPVRTVPSSLIGQNVEVSLVARRVRSFVVPIAALSTSGSGRTYITLVNPAGVERSVWVTLGLSANGAQAVTPVRGTLQAGQQAVIGRQAR